MVCGRGEMNLPADPDGVCVIPQVPLPQHTAWSMVAQPVSKTAVIIAVKVLFAISVSLPLLLGSMPDIFQSMPGDIEY